MTTYKRAAIPTVQTITDRPTREGMQALKDNVQQLGKQVDALFSYPTGGTTTLTPTGNLLNIAGGLQVLGPVISQLGIGITPTGNWVPKYSTLEIGYAGTGMISGNQAPGTLTLVSNLYLDKTGTWRNQTAGYAGAINLGSLANGNGQIYTSTNGAAGAATGFQFVLGWNSDGTVQIGPPANNKQTLTLTGATGIDPVAFFINEATVRSFTWNNGNAAGGTQLYMSAGAGANNSFFQSAPTATYIGTYSAIPFYLQTSGTNRVTVSATGQVTVSGVSSGNQCLVVNPTTVTGGTTATIYACNSATSSGIALDIVGSAATNNPSMLRFLNNAYSVLYGSLYADSTQFIINTNTSVSSPMLLQTGGSTRVTIAATGAVTLAVPNATGYGTPTGGARQASFAAGSITLANLAAAVAQLINDLKLFGVIGA